MKTLYITDLDGTLLKYDETISDFTAKTINELVNNGLNFSFATARSFYSASKMVEKLKLNIPAVTFNGTFITDTKTGENIYSNVFDKKDVNFILNFFHEHKLSPIVHSFVNGVEKTLYYKERLNEFSKLNIENKIGDIRLFPVENKKLLNQGEIFYFDCLGTMEEMRPLYDKLKDKYGCICAKDTYSDMIFFEIMPKNVSKASAIKKLKEILGIDKIVCFGDGLNDIPMFELSDESYAVENACNEIKKIATAVIESNENDGVAKFLLNL